MAAPAPSIEKHMMTGIPAAKLTIINYKIARFVVIQSPRSSAAPARTAKILGTNSRGQCN